MKFKKLFGRKKNHSRKPRASAFVLESLEPRLLLSATPMTAAVVTTDHLDYAPGETAVITTANTNGDGLQFAAGEMVSFQVTRTDHMADYSGSTSGVGPAGNEAWYVTDGVGGFSAHLGSDVSGDGVADWIAPDNDLTVNSSISTTWFVEEQYRNSSLLVTASGQESGAVATQAFTDAATNTSTVLTATSATTVFGTRLDFTATVTAVAGTVDPTGSVEFFADGVSLGVETAFSGGAADGVVQFKTNLFAFQLTAGVHSINAVFTGTVGSFNDSTSANISHTVTQKHITGRFTADLSKVYDGTTVATGVATLNNVELIDVGNVSLVGVANFDTANVGIKKAVTFTGGILTGSAAGNYILDSVRGDLADITPATVSVSNYTGVYDGLAHGATIVGAPGEDLSSSLIMTKHTNVGTFTEGWTFSNANYVAASGTNTITITKSNATIVASGYNGVYDGAAHTATLTATGVLGESLSGLVLNAAPHSNVGTYSDGWTFTDSTGNYNSTSGSVVSNITALGITGNFTAANKVYDGSTAAAVQTRTLAGVLAGDVGSVSLTGGTATFANVNVGTGKTVTLTGAALGGTASGNYSLTSVNTTTANITALGITGNFTVANKVYDGNTVAAVQTRTLSGVLAGDVGNVSLIGVTAAFNNANAGTGKTVTLTGATITGTAVDNYSLTSVNTTTANITKANATITATGYNVVYDGAAHTATGTATGVLGESLSGLNLSVTSHTNAGLYRDIVTFTDVTGNYLNASKAVRNDIAKANATIVVTGYNVVYNGLAHTATGTATGVLGESLSGLGLSGTTHTNVGTGVYADSVIFTDVTGNYNNATKLVTDRISKANITFTVTGYAVRFDGAAHQATATATGVLGESLSGIDLSGTTHTTVGAYVDTVTFTDVTGNYKNATKLVKNFIV